MSKKIEVVVVGAGIAGAPLAHSLGRMNLTNVNVTVVERREATFLKHGGARAVVKGNMFSYRTLVPNNNIIPAKAGKVIHASVKAVDVSNQKLQLDGDVTELKFDYLVVATGSQNQSAAELPLSVKTFKGSQDYFDSVHAKIESADSIMVLGSGPVGTELVGELCDVYPSKMVSVVDLSPHILSGVKPALPQKMINRLEGKMRQIGARMYMGQGVNVNFSEFREDNTIVSKGKRYETDKGEKIQADLVIKCVGTKLNTSFLPDEWKNEHSQVRVNEYFQVVSDENTLENVFAIGDITDLPESKMGYLGQLHAAKVAGNLKKAVDNKDKNSWKKYSPCKDTKMAIPLGRSKGQGYFGIHMGNFLVSNIKGKDLFITRKWKLFHMRRKLLKENDAEWQEKTKAW